jgi:hypothetical protein
MNSVIDRLRWSSTLSLLLAIAASPVSAQPAVPQPKTQAPARLPGAMGIEEATELTNGWALLAEGRAEQAAARAARVLAADPRSASALMLAVEAEIARAGAGPALTRYEAWLGQRTIEEAGVLRRVAQAALKGEAAQRQDSAARLEALRALVQAGDGAAEAELARAVVEGRSAETRILAAMGNQRAVTVLLADLGKGLGNPVLTIDALGRSGSKQAIAPLLAKLEDPKNEVRGAALEALGRLGGPDIVPRLKPLLADRSGYVRVKAAGALYRMGDDSGLQVLQELTAEPAPNMRLAAADAMASRPDGTWLALVRELTAAPDLEVRASAARLIAPHDPELARSVLESLAANENPAIRELASQGLGEVPSDLTSLRRLMRSPDRLMRIRAAGRVMVVTR